MSHPPADPFPVGLSEAEKRDLDEMIADFHRSRPEHAPDRVGPPVQVQMDALAGKLSALSDMVLTIDRQMASLAEVIRLCHHKSELLNQRLDAVIAALKKGRML